MKIIYARIFLEIFCHCPFPIISEPYTDYFLRVRAETGGGYSDYSNLISTTTDVEGKKKT